MTEYRVVSDGYAYYLQYMKVYKVLFFTVRIWTDVPRPYYDKVSGDFLALRPDISVNSYNTENLKEMADQYPEIEEYLTKVYEPEMERLRGVARAHREEVNRRSEYEERIRKATVDWKCSKLEEKK